MPRPFAQWTRPIRWRDALAQRPTARAGARSVCRSRRGDSGAVWNLWWDQQAPPNLWSPRRNLWTVCAPWDLRVLRLSQPVAPSLASSRVRGRQGSRDLHRDHLCYRGWENPPSQTRLENFERLVLLLQHPPNRMIRKRSGNTSGRKGGLRLLGSILQVANLFSTPHVTANFVNFLYKILDFSRGIFLGGFENEPVLSFIENPGEKSGFLEI